MRITTGSLVRDQQGYNIIEMVFSVALLSMASAGIFGGIQILTRTNDSVANRSSMHAGTRNATELMQQEIGQAGKVAFTPFTLMQDVTGNPNPPDVWVNVSSIDKLYVGLKLYILPGALCVAEHCSAETVAITGLNNTTPPQIKGRFLTDHVNGANVSVRGAFSSGVIPPTDVLVNGSSGTVLKLFGDVNDDGTMVYVEYNCDINTGNLYRNQMAFDAGLPKPAPTVSQVLLTNLQQNPDLSPCFTYEKHKILNDYYVTDVAITLTVRTPKRDPITGQFQNETKALLNVSPRNVFEVWQMATMNMPNRVQPTPPTVTALLPN